MEVLLSKIRITGSIVHKIRNHLSQRILLLLYNSMIKCHLQYCIMTWCNGNKTMVKKLQSSDNKFIRLIFKFNYIECKNSHATIWYFDDSSIRRIRNC